VEVGNYALPGEPVVLPAKMKLIDHYIYMFDPAGVDLRVIDVANPTAPVQVGLYEKLGQIWAVEVGADGQTYAYLYDTERNVRIVKLIDLTTAMEVGSFDAPDSAGEISVADGRMYISTLEGLVLVDISNPASPVEIGRYQAGSGTGPVQQVGGYTYIPSGHQVLQIVDLVSSSEAKTIGLFTGLRAGQLNKIIADHNRVYVELYEQDSNFNSSLALQVIDVTDPATPAEIGYYHPSDFEIADVAGIENNYLYLIDQQSRLQLIDLSDPAQPRQVTTPNLSGPIRAVTTEGDYIYLVGDEIGLVISRLNRK
jgi:hypothetical protein